MFKKRLTKKRFKKLLMGQYKFSRNRAEGLANEYPRSIEIKGNKTIINGHVHVFDDPLTLFCGRAVKERIETEFAAYYNSELHYLFQSNAPIGGDRS